MTDDSDTPIGNTEDDKIVREAKKRFRRCADWEYVARGRFVDDIKFCNGDAYNLFQWPKGVRSSRGYGTGDERPCLTINKTAQHCLQVINDARQNKSTVKVSPMGDGATYEAAQVMEGIVRHIDYASDAQSAYMHATTFQVQGGIGYVRVTTEFIDDVTFDQDIFIKRIDDPLSVYLDPDYKEADGADARFAFVFMDMARDEFEAQYPKVQLPPKGVALSTIDANDAGWIEEDHVRVAEYYYRNEKRDKLVVFVNPDGSKTPIKMSEMSGMEGALKKAFHEQLDDPDTKTRDIIGHDVKWVKIAGNQIIERKDWAGDTVPIAFAEGIKTVIDGEMDRKGHTRALIDAQRMLNFNASAAVEFGALQGKQPWVAPAQAIEELEAYWDTANTQNYSVLPWNHKDDDGNPIPPPFRPQPPTGAPLYQQGMQDAATHMMLVSGQYQPTMGEPSNERSGKAIQARQRQGENATYHFIDHQARMIRRVGKIIIDLIPKIYDTPRMLKILGEDGSDSDVFVDPDAKAAHQVEKAKLGQAAERIVINPSVGRYEVISDVGPDFATRRQEAFNALSQIAQQNPELMSIIGDLVMLAADFPLADEAAERLKRMVPPQALGEGIPPAVTKLQAELQSTQGLMAAMTEKLMTLRAKTTQVDEQKGIDTYKAVTDRLDVLMKYSQIPARDLMQFQHDLAKQEHAGNLDVVGKVIDASLADNADDTQEAA